MTSDEIIKTILYPAIEKANQNMPNFSIGVLSESTPLYGETNAILDSLNLVSWIFLIEEQVQSVTGVDFKFSTQDILNREEAPFANLKSLSLFLKVKIEGAKS